MSDPVSPTTVNEREIADPSDPAAAEPVEPLGNPDPAEPGEPLADPAAAAAVIDGKQFAPVANTASGEVGATTVFHYHQDGKVIWAEYSGGAVVRGYLIGSGWKDYCKTGRVSGVELPAGFELAQRLREPIFTPSTKAAAGHHDENISTEQVKKLIGAELTTGPSDDGGWRNTLRVPRPTERAAR